MMKKLILILAITCTSCSQNNSDSANYEAIDISGFYDSAHHWYDVHDEGRMIDPAGDQAQYDATEITKIADNIILFQKTNGGWAKNYDMGAILTKEQRKAVLNGKDETNTTFDNGATHSQIQYLAEAYTKTKMEKYKEACIKGIEFTLEAQYNNGGWPQFYPDTSGYRKYITFNDDAMIGTMKMLHKIVNNSPEFSFIKSDLRARVNEAFQKGIDCILKTQIKENGVLNAWCQQHDNVDFHPQNARTYELAVICNGESAGIVKLLMSIDEPDDKIINSIQSAVKWFEKSKIYGVRPEWIKAPKANYQYHSTDSDVIAVEDPDALPVWTRFYELGTHKPMFCRRDGEVVYKLEEVERERRTGYTWYVYLPQEVLDLYPEWQRKWLPNGMF